MLSNIDTIVAVSTGNASAAIGIIRLSGSEAIFICDTIFKGAKLSKVQSHTLHFGKILDNEQSIIDEVVVGVFRNPKSYTGEDVVEISCHGSNFIIQKIVDLCINNGARLATAGEFTKRAFMNGKLDLSQAEAVADLIASENESQHQMAMNQLRGGFSLELNNLREKLINFSALIELELDFSEEDVEFANRDEFKKLIIEIENKIKTLKDSFQYGNAIKNGISTVIAGKPNAGKSTLLNQLLNEDRAIVSEIAGTTRDTIEEILVINGIKFRLIDTAGIRHETSDIIEKIGIEKTIKAVDAGQIFVYLFDVSTSKVKDIVEDIEKFYNTNSQLVLLANKIELINEQSLSEFQNTIETNLNSQNINFKYINISAKENKNIEVLKNALFELVSANKINEGNVIVSNARHYEALKNVYESLQKIKEGMQQNISGDLIAIDIRECLYQIGLITGKIEHDKDILGTIFGKFCIGK